MSHSPVGLTRAEEILEMPSVKSMRTVKVPLCEACGQYHGSAAIGFECLRSALVAERAASAKDRAKIANLTAENAELRRELAARGA